MGPTFVRLTAQVFYVKKAVVLVVSQMAPTYTAGGGGTEKLLEPFEITNEHIEEVEVRTLVHLPYHFAPLALNQQLMPRSAWTVMAGAISFKGWAVEAQCTPLLSFLHAAAVEGSAIPFETADLEVITPDKALEAQQMEILRRDFPPAL